MEVVRTPSEARRFARALSRPLGFVPTMGALHSGHLALIERAQAENRATAVSIFVNPLQFGPSEDFARYPRTFNADLALLESAGVDFVYAPSVEEMYPPGFHTSIGVEGLAHVFEGAVRPGHFAGVALVVAKLLNAVEPTRLYLGQKDAQQAAVVRGLIEDLDMGVELVVCPTVREADGLALSSRNIYLASEQRAAAPSLYRALVAVRAALENGVNDVAAARARGIALLEEPLTWEYLEVVDPKSFALQTQAAMPALILAAVRVGGIRLLDNLLLP